MNVHCPFISFHQIKWHKPLTLLFKGKTNEMGQNTMSSQGMMMRSSSVIGDACISCKIFNIYSMFAKYVVPGRSFPAWYDIFRKLNMHIYTFLSITIYTLISGRSNILFIPQRIQTTEQGKTSRFRIREQPKINRVILETNMLEICITVLRSKVSRFLLYQFENLKHPWYVFQSQAYFNKHTKYRSFIRWTQNFHTSVIFSMLILDNYISGSMEHEYCLR